MQWKPIPVAARSKSWVCGHLFAGISGSNSARGMDTCLLWVLCVAATGLHSSRRVLLSVVCLSVCDLETSKMKRHRPTTLVKPLGGDLNEYCLACIYLIGRFRIISENRLLASSRPSVCPHVSARLPPDGFSWNLTLGNLTKICRETLRFG
jgi:hypothetical protein